MEHGRFPWIPPTVLPRPELDRWFAYHAQVPVRFVWGPCGWGKTTAAVLAARTNERRAVHVPIPPSADVTALLAACGGLLPGPVASLDELLTAFDRSGIGEVILDGVDDADATLRAALGRLPTVLEHELRLIYIARARTAIDLLGAVTSGTAVVLDPMRLALSATEIADICERLGVPVTQYDASYLAFASDGWPFVAMAVVREAAADALPLAGAYERWQLRHGRLLGDLAARSLDRLGPEARREAEAMYGGAIADTQVAAALSDAGVLLLPSSVEPRPLRPVTDALGQGAVLIRFANDVPEPRGTAEIELFGAFSMTIDGRSVPFARRRDRQLVQYLALTEEGRATREELIAVFWPHAEPALAAQSLRSTCSTIRRAIARCAGPHRVDQFFVADRFVSLPPEGVTPSTRRFRAEMRCAEDALQRGDPATAALHFTAALRLYRAPLLAAEPPASWIHVQAEALAQMAQRALRALREECVSGRPVLAALTP